MQCNSSLDDLPHKTAGVSTAVDEVDTFKFPEDNPNLFHKLDTPPTLLVPTVLMMDDNNENPVDDKEAVNIEAIVLGSTTIDGLRRSTQVPLPPRITKVSFNNKSYSHGSYKDGTMHIMVGAGHDNDHPSLIDPDPYVHVLGVAMLHYSNPDIVRAAFAQSYGFKTGLKKFRKIGEKATMTELTQLHDYTTYHPVHASSLSPEDHQKALSSLVNIVEKRGGRGHAHTCMDGSPTVATESILISATIDAHKGHNVATINIPGAFLNAYNNKDTSMLLKGVVHA